MQLKPEVESVLRSIEEDNLKNGPYWIVGHESGRMLQWLVRVLQPEVLVEVGTSVGYSAIWMATALEANGKGKIWTIESHSGRFEKAQANIAKAGMTLYIEQILGHAPEVFEDNIPDEVQMAFFDATKMETKSFFEAVFPRMKSGGMIVVDNVTTHRAGMLLQFIEELYGRKDVEVVELQVGGGLLLARKI
jgi:predicted O-methyltransferase YrrM